MKPCKNCHHKHNQKKCPNCGRRVVMNAEQLKACPMCGERAAANSPAGNQYYVTECFHCGLRTDDYLDVDKANKAWNTRAESRPAVQADCDEMYDKIFEAIKEMKSALQYYDAQKKHTFEPPNNFRAKTPARKALEVLEAARPEIFRLEMDVVVDEVTIPSNLENYITLGDALALLSTEYVGGTYNADIRYHIEVIARVREIIKSVISPKTDMPKCGVSDGK